MKMIKKGATSRLDMDVGMLKKSSPLRPYMRLSTMTVITMTPTRSNGRTSASLAFSSFANPAMSMNRQMGTLM